MLYGLTSGDIMVYPTRKLCDRGMQTKGVAAACPARFWLICGKDMV